MENGVCEMCTVYIVHIYQLSEGEKAPLSVIQWCAKKIIIQNSIIQNTEAKKHLCFEHAVCYAECECALFLLYCVNYDLWAIKYLRIKRTNK